MVSVKPACAGADLEAVQKIINLVVCDIQGMYGAVQVVEEQVTVSQAQDYDMATFRKGSIKPVEKLQDVGLEMVKRSIPTGAASANVIADKLQEK